MVLVNQINYYDRDIGTESKVKEGVYRVKIEEVWYYAVKLDSVPDKYLMDLKMDFKAASTVLNSIENLNVPSACFDFSGETEVFLTEDMGIGTTEDINSFYEAAAFYILISKNDVKQNIVEGSKGYAPIDFDGFLRSKFTARKYYLKYGAELTSDVKLRNYAEFNIEKEAERHGINYERERLINALNQIAESLRPAVHKLREKEFEERAEVLHYNIEKIID